MAREATISQEEVNAVADSIRAVGIKPAARMVRDRLGRGSMGTVLKLFHVWQSSQARAPESPLTLPVALQRSLLDCIGQEVAAAKLSRVRPGNCTSSMGSAALRPMQPTSTMSASSFLSAR